MSILARFSSIMVKVLDCGFKGSEFEFHLRYYVQFRTNILKRGMTSYSLPSMG